MYSNFTTFHNFNVWGILKRSVFQNKKTKWKIKLDANKTWSCFVYFFLWTSIVFFQHKKCFHLLFILEYSLASICGWKVKKKKVNSWTMIISIFMLIQILHLSKNLTLWIIKTMKSTKIDIQCKYWWNHNKKNKENWTTCEVRTFSPWWFALYLLEGIHTEWEQLSNFYFP